MVEASLYLTGALCLAGGGFILVAALGVVRLGDLYMRMHAASKAGTVGVGALLLALAVSSGDGAIALRAVGGTVFFLLTTPVAAHLLARSAYLSGHRPSLGTRRDALRAHLDRGQSTADSPSEQRSADPL